MGGPNLEVFKFGMYILFPIGIMYYFGTNLDSRFSTPNFWPKEGQTHTIPFEKEDIQSELQRLRERRLQNRARRLEMEAQGFDMDVTRQKDAVSEEGPREILGEVKTVEPEKSPFAREGGGGKGWFGGWLK